MPDDALATPARLPEGAPAAIAAEIGYLRTVAGTAALHPGAFDFAVLAPRFDRALSALEAALATADEWEGKALVMRTALRQEAARTGFVEAGRGMVAAGRQTAANELRAAIAREMTGKADGNAEG